MRIYDISPPLHPGVAVWPGDTRFERRVSLSLSRGDSVELSDVRLSLHTGAHADAPCHFTRDDWTIDLLELEPYWGPARLFTVPGRGAILARHLDAVLDDPPERLLLRAHPDFDPDRFPSVIRHLTAGTAEMIGMAGVLLVGIDAPSVDPLDSKTLRAHKTLQRAGTRILENLWLRDVPDGEYELSALPLSIVAGDASPVRAALRTARPPLPGEAG